MNVIVRGIFTLVTLAAVLLGATSANAQGLTKELASKITQLVDADTKRLTDIFKDLHQHPELGLWRHGPLGSWRRN